MTILAESFPETLDNLERDDGGLSGGTRDLVVSPMGEKALGVVMGNEVIPSQEASRADRVVARADILNAYSLFEPAVAPLIEAHNKATSKEDLLESIEAMYEGIDVPVSIADGGAASVFKIVIEGKSYAVRLANSDEIEGYIKGSSAGRGIKGLEQMIAASVEDLITISEIIPGKNGQRLNLDDMEAITDEQLISTLQMLKEAVDNGVRIDPNATNFMYDRDVGFGILDYGYDPNIEMDFPLEANVAAFAHLIAEGSLYSSVIESEEDAAAYYSKLEARLRVLKRFSDICRVQNEGERVVSEAVRIADYFEATMQRYAPGSAWVKEQVRQAVKLREWKSRDIKPDTFF